MKKAIVFSGPMKSGKDYGASIAGSYVRKFHSMEHTKFTAPLNQGINIAFGLPFSDDLYLRDFGDQAISEFFGHTPREAYAMVLAFYQERFKYNFLGRVAARRLNIKGAAADVTIFSDCPSSEDVEALAIGLKPENVLVLHLNERPGPEWQRHTLQQVKQRFIDNTHKDRETFQLMVKGSCKSWLGLDDD